MVTRIRPNEYLNSYDDYPQQRRAELYEIPSWVPILLGIALVGAFAVALYSISKRR